MNQAFDAIITGFNKGGKKERNAKRPVHLAMKKLMLAAAALSLIALLSGCAASESPQTTQLERKATAMTNVIDGTYIQKDGQAVIYLAGGCFWGMEKLAEALPGVKAAVSGYANGTADSPTYELVCKGGTGFKETVRVEYAPEEITLEQILSAYFLVIDPTVANRQGNDTGSQYQTGIYYADAASGETVERVIAQEKKRQRPFYVEHGPLTSFYDAEAYHQDYLAKNPGGYCHIPKAEMEAVTAVIAAERAYTKPTDEALRSRLTPQQYDVTQNAATERAFTGEYWDNHAEGIYVDIVTGQPLFSSADQYSSGCGWPSFTAPILAGSVRYRADSSHGMERTEVTSANGGAHLGHVFEGDGESPNGVRYCINSAALRFVPKARMTEEGYGAYLIVFR